MASVDVDPALVNRTGTFVGGRLADVTCRTEMPTRSPALAGTVDTCGTKMSSRVTPVEGCATTTRWSRTRCPHTPARTTAASIREGANLGCMRYLRSHMFIHSELRARYRFPTAVETDEVLPVDDACCQSCRGHSLVCVLLCFSVAYLDRRSSVALGVGGVM